MEQTMEFTRDVMEALGAPFPENELEFLPRAQSGGKAMGLAYIDARSVMARLDAVVGPANWSFDFDVLTPDAKRVKGRLTVLGVTKCDAGEASGEDEVLKAAVSDALKRCAVHFGIGRYLYHLPPSWAPYDAQKRRFTEAPRLDPVAVRNALARCGIPDVGSPNASLRLADSLASGARERSLERSPKKEESAAAPGQCVCGALLTRNQLELSVRNYGAALCPACQKGRTRLDASSRPAAAVA